MLKYIYSIVMVSVICSGCNNAKKEVEKNQFVFSKFPEEKHINFTNVFQFENGIVSRIYIRDSTLIVYDWRAKSGFFFHAYSLNSKQSIGQYIPHGRSKGKALGSVSAGLYHNSLWMYDLILDKIILSDLKTTLTDTNTIYKEYPFSQKFYNIQFLDNSKVIANGNYERTDQLQEVDLNSGKIIAEFGVLNDVPKDIPFYAWKRANEGLLVVNSGYDKAAIAHLWSDKIEIFDLKTRKKLMIMGPENFNPEFIAFKSDDGRDLIGRNEKSRNGFSGLVATEKFIYALYSGNNMSSPYISYGKTLFVYNWDGEPVKKISFDNYVSSFTVSENDQKIYAYDVVSKYIVTAAL